MVISREQLNHDVTQVMLSEILLKNPNLVESWEAVTSIVQESSGSNHLHRANRLNQCLELFVSRFPYEASYWKSRVDEVARTMGYPTAELICEKALGYLQYDLLSWLNFLRIKIVATKDVAQVLQAFEQCRVRVGMHYFSAAFYELYFSFLTQYSPQILNYEKKLSTLANQMSYIPMHSLSCSLSLSCDDVKLEISGSERHSSMYSNRVLHDIMSAYVYHFEKEILSLQGKPVMLERISVWLRYTDSLKNAVPDLYILHLFERASLSTNFAKDIVLSYTDFLLKKGLRNKAKDVWKRALLVHSDVTRHVFFLRLIKLELFEGNILRARDYIAQMLSCNASFGESLAELQLWVENLFEIQNSGGGQ